MRYVLLSGVQIGFTGSTAVGKEILAVASSTMKSTSLECGGKNPLIICADANIDEVCSATIQRIATSVQLQLPSLLQNLPITLQKENLFQCYSSARLRALSHVLVVGQSIVACLIHGIDAAGY